MYQARDPRFHFPEMFHVVWCSACEVAYTLPRLALSELLHYYPAAYDPYRESRFDRSVSRVHRVLLRAEERFGASGTDSGPPGDLLDVGCGNGDYMAAMERRGFRATGVEIAAPAVGVARDRGLRVIHGDFLAEALPSRSFDVVAMNHYLEHSLDPRASLRKAHGLLRPDGVLAVGVPNFSSVLRRLFGPAWSDLDVPRHVVHFTPAGLTRLLVAEGFTVKAVQHDPAAVSGSLLASLLVKVGKQDDPVLRKASPLLHSALYPIGMPMALLRQSPWMRFVSRSVPRRGSLEPEQGVVA